MVDLVEITVKAGAGGDGAVSFHREKYKPKGPPDGGDGGKGGDVYLLVEANLATLYDFQRQRYFKAEDGKRGGSNHKKGKGGQDLVLKVPVGTIVGVGLAASRTPRGTGVPAQTEVRATASVPVGTGQARVAPTDLVNHGQQLIVAKGGAGGRGNAKLRSSTNRSPRWAEKGKPGEEKVLTLELKLIADVGLVGLPNAGKTTLLNALTGARGKVGRYPFTTLSPNLGVLFLSKNKVRPHQKNRQIIIADIPGLIEGASEGKGLGHTFLRHIERTKVLVHLIDPAQGGLNPPTTAKSQNFAYAEKCYMVERRARDIEKIYETVREELHQFSPRLLERPEIVVINKLDLPEVKEMYPKIKKALDSVRGPVLGISALTGEGLEGLKEAIVGATFMVARSLVRAGTPVPLPTFTIDDLPNKHLIFRKQ